MDSLLIMGLFKCLFSWALLTMAISPINSLRCCSKYVFSLVVPAAEAKRCCDAMLLAWGVLRLEGSLN
jgi:hypothetical protein